MEAELRTLGFLSTRLKPWQRFGRWILWYRVFELIFNQRFTLLLQLGLSISATQWSTKDR